MGRDRGTTGRPDGTDNPFKKLTPDSNDPTKVTYKDPHTGKVKTKAKPPGFDEYWKKKHPEPQPKPTECPTPKPVPTPEPQKFNIEDFYCKPGQIFDCVPRGYSSHPGLFPVPVNPTVPNMPTIPLRVPMPVRIPIEIPIFLW